MVQKRNTPLFVFNFMRNPLRNASLVPSSRAAASAMLNGVDFSKVNVIVELGPGTGVFTEEILRRCKPETKILLLELEPTYVHVLRDKFGEKIVVENKSAHSLNAVMKKHGISHVDLIVSGLPTYPRVITKEFVEILRAYTDRGTVYRFFTYVPPFMKRVYKNLPIRKKAFTIKNFPPLWVYGIN